MERLLSVSHYKTANVRFQLDKAKMMRGMDPEPKRKKLLDTHCGSQICAEQDNKLDGQLTTDDLSMAEEAVVSFVQRKHCGLVFWPYEEVSKKCQIILLPESLLLKNMEFYFF